MKKNPYIDDYGCIRPSKEIEFIELEAKIAKLLRPFSSHMSYKDLYNFASMAAAGAVGKLVVEDVNKNG